VNDPDPGPSPPSPGAQDAARRPIRPPPGQRQAEHPVFDLSKIRHNLRTPINHILGYCEMLQEDESLPGALAPDLARIHAGGRQLLALIAAYFDEETFETKRGDVHRLGHDLRTPVNQIIGYSEMLAEQAEELQRTEYAPELQKIRDAAALWLGLMEEHLLPVGDPAAAGRHAAQPGLLPPGITYRPPAPELVRRPRTASGRLLVVDDDEANRDILSRRLRRDGYDVETASNGVEALRLLRASPFDLILLDLVMPGLDGYQVLVKMKSEPALREIPVIMLSALDQEDGIARCIELGAEDFVSKPFSPVFLRARLDASLERKRLLDQERKTHQALVASQKRLAAELAEAASYVRSLLPDPFEESIRVSWRFQPCAELGGDIFGYHWMDANRLAIYLLDVSGHGMGAALLSVSISNMLRSQSLSSAQLGDPAEVLGQLNRMFPMEEQNNLLFTMWYGVLDRKRRRLAYASGGHPPAVLVNDASDELRQLGTGGRLLGCDPDSAYRSATCPVRPGDRLFVFSDGAYEIARPDGRTAEIQDLLDALQRTPLQGGSKLDGIMAWAATTSGDVPFDDDLSILEIVF
jgi:sigma-B regulation protein RsbU (phosphoserine phosphatase)